MKFSIVTPSYNHGRFIRDCLESVRQQAGVEWEHIVTDAGSTDETVAVLKEYPHLKWTSEPDRGMSDGINKGFRQATGDWVMWLNTDDYLLPGTLAKVAAFAGRHPHADIIYGECVFVNEQKRPLRYRREHRFDFGVLLYYGCYIPSTTTFLNRRIITAGHLVDVDYRVCMDFEYYVRLARLGYRFEFLRDFLACFRWHEVNTSTVQAKRRREERIQVQRKYQPAFGRGLLRQEWALDGLSRVFQAKRQILRLLARISPG